MLERFYRVYEGSNFFIAYNEKKIAADNIKAVEQSPVFITLSILIYFVVSWCCNLTIRFDVILFVPVIVVGLCYLAYRQSVPYIRISFNRVRVFSLAFYSVIFLAFGLTEAYIKPSRMSVILPIGIFIITSVYLDYFVRMLIYKVVLSLVFLTADYWIKRNPVIREDIILIALSIMVTSLCYYVLMNNITDRSEVTHDMEKKSKTDILTGLLNKKSFEERSKEYITERNPGAKATLFVFDFDDFKYINEDYGHQIGDELLKHFGAILREYFHPSDVVGRVGGDKFMVLVMGEMPETFIEKRCKNIEQDLAKLKIEDAKGFSCSIGICEDKNSHSFDEIKNIAGRALFEAKERGKGLHVVKHG
ncbi:GGDEF domain-containing protein [Butyrivibrio sp. INlla21]|uniref:GGDEF domain-containing protein n=1 Tax=Butyrivibrio sp. INlla21 TaxID=1520811 RepID=UPI0008EC91D5|nr:GGDEF domain-containing protein [Butyrivibrio sp. INlla21]SFU82230.1 diguanylate cyclase (GGDEF) domain-containing protein [Butyrivibrio sp. INlla21]